MLLGDNEEAALLILGKAFIVSNQNDYEIILRQAAQAECTDFVQFLQEIYASSFGDTGSAQCKDIEAAILKGRLGVLKRNIWKSSNPKQYLPISAISRAELGGQDHMVVFLLYKGLKMERECLLDTPLRVASLMGHEPIVRILPDRGTTVDGSLGDALQAAAMKGHVSITKLLIQKGGDANNAGGYYGNALQAAVYRGHKKVIEVSLDGGACIDQPRDFSRDAFHAAAEGSHEQALRFFLERGLKLNISRMATLTSAFDPSPHKDDLRGASPSRVMKSKKFHGDQLKSSGWQHRALTSEFYHILGASRDVEEIEGNEYVESY